MKMKLTITGEFVNEMARMLDTYIWSFFHHKERGEDVAAAYCSAQSRMTMRWLMECDLPCGRSAFDIIIRNDRDLAKKVDRLNEDDSYRPARDYRRIDA